MCCSDVYSKQTLLSFLLAERQMESWHGALPVPPSSSVLHDKPVFMALNSVCTSVKCVVGPDEFWAPPTRKCNSDCFSSLRLGPGQKYKRLPSSQPTGWTEGLSSGLMVQADGWRHEGLERLSPLGLELWVY